MLLKQNGQTNNVIDNIHSIVAAAAVKFDAQQLEHLFRLIHKVTFSCIHFPWKHFNVYH